MTDVKFYYIIRRSQSNFTERDATVSTTVCISVNGLEYWALIPGKGRTISRRTVKPIRSAVQCVPWDLFLSLQRPSADVNAWRGAKYTDKFTV